MSDQSFWRRWEPAAPIPVHILLSGLVWAGVGIMLMSLAIAWFSHAAHELVYLLAPVGGLAALAIDRFGFSKLAHRNIARLRSKRDRICIFAFQTWQSYLIVVFMMSLGMALRRSTFPKPYLAAGYLGIGGGLFLAGLGYFVDLFKHRRP